MKVQELVEIMSSTKNKMLKPEQARELLKKTIEVKHYIGIKEKKKLINEIVNECILYDEGMFKFDDIDKYICFTMRTIAAYTNLELSEDMENDYDALCEADLLNAVVDTFAGEYDNVHLLLQMKTENILSNNTIESQVARFVEGVLDKVDELVDSLKDKIDELDIGNLGLPMEDIYKVINFVNTNK